MKQRRVTNDAVPLRSKMGKLESRHIRLHQVILELDEQQLHELTSNSGARVSTGAWART